MLKLVSPFPGLWVTLRGRARLKGFELREGLVVAFPNRFGDIAQLDVRDPPADGNNLPCAAEISTAVTDLSHAVLRLRDLPRSRLAPVTIEPSDGSTGVFVRLARDEPAGFTYDILGDGSETVEYTYDGRILGIRLANPLQGSGTLMLRVT